MFGSRLLMSSSRPIHYFAAGVICCASLTTILYRPLSPVEIGYLDFLAHISEEDLELYAMRMAPEADLERVEEHLLTCGECRDRLIETERVIAAFQAAAARIRDSGANPLIVKP